MEYSPFSLGPSKLYPSVPQLEVLSYSILPDFPFPKISLSSRGPILPAVLWGAAPGCTEAGQPCGAERKALHFASPSLLALSLEGSYQP